MCQCLLPATDITDTLQEFMALQQLYDAGIKEVRTKLEILDDDFAKSFKSAVYSK